MHALLRFSSRLLFVASVSGPLLAHEGEEHAATFWPGLLFGRLHVMIVHFPIVLIALVGFIELWRWKRHETNADPLLLTLTGLAAFSAVVAAGMGWVDASTMNMTGSEAALLNIHRWLGVATAGVAVLMAATRGWLFRHPSQAFLIGHRIIVLIAVILVSVAGHFGGLLTHGADYLDSALPWHSAAEPPKSDGMGNQHTMAPGAPMDGMGNQHKTVPMETPQSGGSDNQHTMAPGTPMDGMGNQHKAAPAMPADSTSSEHAMLPSTSMDREHPSINFNQTILPVLTTSCIECHGPDKQRGDLRVDSRAALLLGGASGPTIVPGHGADSLLIQRVRGLGGDPRMPRKKDPLSEETILKITQWIDQGAVWPEAPGAAKQVAGTTAATAPAAPTVTTPPAPAATPAPNLPAETPAAEAPTPTGAPATAPQHHHDQ